MEVVAEENDAPNPAPLAVVAFLAPWFFVSAMLPDPYRWEAFGLLTLLAFLLVGAAAWSYQAARERGYDPTHWAFVAVLTSGAAMILLLGKPHRDTLGRYCVDCGRAGAHSEPFCFGCGSAS